MEQNDNGLSNERLTEQLMALTKRVYNLEQEVTTLKSQLNGGVALNKVPSKAPASYQQPVAVNGPKPQNVASVKAAPAVAAYQPPKTQPVVKKEKKNMESNIGKNLMGIFASLLILLSFVLFAAFAFPFLPDVAKVIILYVVSIAFAAFGLLKMNKKSSFNVLFTSFAGIGVSGFYVVSFIASFVFNIMNEFVLLAIIIVWLIVTGIISKYKSRMFMYICNIGLVIASFLVFVEWKDVLAGLIMYYVGAFLLYYMNKSEKLSKDFYWLIQIPVISLIYVFLYLDNMVALVIIAVLSTVFIVAPMFLYKVDDKNGAGFIFLNLLGSSVLFFAQYALYDEIDLWGTVIGVTLFLVVTVIAFIKYYENNKTYFYVPFFVFALSLLSLNVGVISDYVSMIPFAVIMIALGIVLKDSKIKYTGYFYYLLYIFEKPKLLNEYAYLIIATVAFIALVVLCIKKYSKAQKYILTFVTFALLVIWIDTFKLGGAIGFFAFAIVSILMNTKFYRINPITKLEEKSSVILGYVVNGLIILFGFIDFSASNELFIRYDGQVIVNNIITTAIYIAVLLAVCCINVVRLVNNKNNEMLFGIYNCLKLTILILIVLDKFDVMPMIISIIAILVAISCIVLGFVFKHKSFRIYGLVLTIVFVMKLCLVDITYDSPIFRPVGFFVAGILCFAISWIYAKLEKNTQVAVVEEKKEIEE